MMTRDWYAGHGGHVRRYLLTRWLLWGVAAAFAGCSSGSNSGSGQMAPPVVVVAPAITMQPADQSVPMGLSASYSVTATGSSLQYQWAKNGAAIAGATGTAYVTPPTAFTDTGASFSVTVSNSAGTMASSAALLTVTARAPAAGDLRFQQVDASTTVNGWGNAGAGISTDLPGRSAMSFSPSLGTPFYVGASADCGTPPTMNGMGCSWFFSETPVAEPASAAALIAGYGADFYDSFQADLQSPTSTLLSFGNGVTAVSPESVITSLDLEPASNLFALSWVQTAPSSSAMSSAQSTTQTSFVMEQNNVAPADLQAAATADGAAGRVITAISNNGGTVTYFAYAWQADTTTLYETKVAIASTVDAAAGAASLAAEGYIITATGQADNTGNIYIVGTRVQGDTLARPFVAAQGSAAIQAMEQQGYAGVGVILNLKAEPEYTYLGER
jgi:hypothetical protein